MPTGLQRTLKAQPATHGFLRDEKAQHSGEEATLVISIDDLLCFIVLLFKGTMESSVIRNEPAALSTRLSVWEGLKLT